MLTKKEAGLEPILEIFKVDSSLLTQFRDHVGYILNVKDVKSLILYGYSFIAIVWEL